MKKSLCFFLCLCAVISLAACGKQSGPDIVIEPLVTEAADVHESSAAAAAEPSAYPEEGFEVQFSGEDTMRMSNYMNEGRYVLVGASLYGQQFSKDTGRARLARISAKNGGTIAVLDEDISPSFMCYESTGKYLYYIRREMPSGGCALARISTAEGSAPELIYEHECDYLFISGRRLWFTDEEHRLVSTDLNGGDMEIIVDKEVYFPYLINDDILLFQDDGDGETLHMLKLSSGEETRLLDDKCYSFILSGRALFCAVTGESGSSRCRLCRLEYMTVPGSEGSSWQVISSDEAVFPFLMTDGDTLLGVNGSSVQTGAWKTLSNYTAAGKSEMYAFISQDYLVRYVLNPETDLVREIYIVKRADGVLTDVPFCR